MNFQSLDLNLLRVLDALLKEGSTIKAGARVGLSQPAVSAALSRLRHALGDPIFVRHGVGLEPTEYALKVKRPLAEALEQLDAVLRRSSQFDPMAATNRFLLSGPDFYAELLMPDLAARMSREAPNMHVQMVNVIGDTKMELFDLYDVDIALMPTINLPNFIAAQPAHQSSFLVIAREGHPRLKRAGIAPGDVIPLDLYCDLSHILISTDGKPVGIADKALAEIGRQRRVVMTLPFFSGVYHVVGNSDLIGLLPQQLGRKLARNAGLEIYLPPIRIEPLRLMMAWPKRLSNEPAHRWLRDLIADLLERLNKDEPNLQTP